MAAPRSERSAHGAMQGCVHYPCLFCNLYSKILRYVKSHKNLLPSTCSGFAAIGLLEKKKIKRFYAEYITVIKLVYNGKHPPPQNSPALQEPALTSPANDSAHYKVQKSLVFFPLALQRGKPK